MSVWMVLIILVLLPVGLLSVPLTFEAVGCLRTEERRLKAKIAWGWGLFAAAIGIDGGKTSFGLRLAGIALPAFRKKSGTVRAEKIGKKTEKKAEKKAGRKGEKHGFNFFAVNTVLNRKLLTAVLGYFKSLIKSFRLRLRLSGAYGTDDPALTGLIVGLISALRADHFNLELDADFSGPVLDIAGESSGRILPIVILWLTLRLLLAGPVRKLWWAQLKNKLIRRKPKEAVQYV